MQSVFFNHRVFGVFFYFIASLPLCFLVSGRFRFSGSRRFIFPFPTVGGDFCGDLFNDLFRVVHRGSVFSPLRFVPGPSRPVLRFRRFLLLPFLLRYSG